jgi:hypothetical protein
MHNNIGFETMIQISGAEIIKDNYTVKMIYNALGNEFHGIKKEN